MTLDDIVRFCGTREVDVELAEGDGNFKFSLRGCFDGDSDFFRILFQDIEYVELAGGFTLGGLMYGDFRELSEKTGRWMSLTDRYSGPAMILWSADAASLETASQAEVFLIIANCMECRPGRDWPV